MDIVKLKMHFSAKQLHTAIWITLKIDSFVPFPISPKPKQTNQTVTKTISLAEVIIV